MNVGIKHFNNLNTLLHQALDYVTLHTPGDAFQVRAEKLAIGAKNEIHIECRFIVEKQPGTVMLKYGDIVKLHTYSMQVRCVHVERLDNQPPDAPKLPNQYDDSYYKINPSVIVCVKLRVVCPKLSDDSLYTILKEHFTHLSFFKAGDLVSVTDEKAKAHWCSIRENRMSVVGKVTFFDMVSGMRARFTYNMKDLKSRKKQYAYNVCHGDAVKIKGIKFTVDKKDACLDSDVITGAVRFEGFIPTRRPTWFRLKDWWKAYCIKRKDK